MFGWGKKKELQLTVDEHAPVQLDKNETVLNAALRAGIAFPHSCKVGGCASCKCQLVSGKVRELTDKAYLLNTEEIRNGYILGCQSIPQTDVVVKLPVNPLANQHIAGKVVRQSMLTHDIGEVFIALDEPVRFLPGQYASVEAVGTGIPARCYSFAHAVGEAGSAGISFFVRKVPTGRMSHWLLDPNALEHRVQLNASLGEFHLRDGKGALVCIAGGSGLAPLIALLEGAVQTDAVQRPVSLLMGARTQRDLYYVEEIRALQQRWRAPFEYIPVLSEEPAGSDWQGKRGWVTEALTPEITCAGAQGYLCGPPPMIDACIGVMTANGMDADAIFFDKFADQSTPAK
jgi:NAD(P)H-flavin reductase/ferredoxin